MSWFFFPTARYIPCSVFYHYQCRKILSFELDWIVTSRVRGTEIKTSIGRDAEISDLGELRVLGEHNVVHRGRNLQQVPWKQTYRLFSNVMLLEGKAVHCSVRFNLDERFARNLDAKVFRCVWNTSSKLHVNLARRSCCEL